MWTMCITQSSQAIVLLRATVTHPIGGGDPAPPLALVTVQA